MNTSGGETHWVENALTIVFVLSFEHWIIASLFWGGLFAVIFTAVNSEAKTDGGAIISGVLACASCVLFGFGVLASVIALIKFLWMNV